MCARICRHNGQSRRDKAALACSWRIGDVQAAVRPKLEFEPDDYQARTLLRSPGGQGECNAFKSFFFACWLDFHFLFSKQVRKPVQEYISVGILKA
jgi:hypothetical protein